MTNPRLLGFATICFSLAMCAAVLADMWAYAAFAGLCSAATLALLALEARRYG